MEVGVAANLEPVTDTMEIGLKIEMPVAAVVQGSLAAPLRLRSCFRRSA